MNAVQLIGNLTRDPEVRQLPSGMEVCDMRVAVSGRRRNGGGEWEDDPNYFDVVAYRTLAVTSGEHLAKGRQVAVTGRLEYREWDHDGGLRSTIEIIASDVDFLSPKPAGAETAEAEAAEAEPAVA